MFQLVVAVISIALIAFMALTSLYYGGDAFSASSLRAGVTTLVNGGTQIAGAATIYETDRGGIRPASIADLTSNATGVTYLRDVPGGAAFTTGAWTLKNGLAFISLSAKADKAQTCAEVARQAGNSGMFRCGGADGVVVAVADATTFVYGRGDQGNGTPAPTPTPPAATGPKLSLSKTTQAFSLSGGSATSPQDSVTVTNTGDQAVANLQLDSSGTSNTVFNWFSFGAGQCRNGLKLDPGASCVITHNFQTIEDGTFADARYRFGVGSGSDPKSYFQLTGTATGVMAAKLTFNPTEVRFSAPDSFAFMTATVVLKNEGKAAADIFGDTYSLDEGGTSGFMYTGSLGDPLPCQGTLAVGATCSFDIKFDARAAAERGNMNPSARATFIDRNSSTRFSLPVSATIAP